MKKAKKLVLKKDVISQLNDGEKIVILGGYGEEGPSSGFPLTCLICTNGCVCGGWSINGTCDGLSCGCPPACPCDGCADTMCHDRTGVRNICGRFR